MSVRFRKIVRRILVAAGVLVGLVVLIVVGAVVTSWYLSFEGFAYDWDPLVENTSGRAGNHYESDRRHRGVAVKGLGERWSQEVGQVCSEVKVESEQVITLPVLSSLTRGKPRQG